MLRLSLLQTLPVVGQAQYWYSPESPRRSGSVPRGFGMETGDFVEWQIFVVDKIGYKLQPGLSQQFDEILTSICLKNSSKV